MRKHLKNKSTVYLDTTIFSYLVDRRKQIKVYTDLTREWWKTERKKYALYLSLETLAEIGAGRYPKKQEALSIAATVDVLQRTEAIENIARIYIKKFVMPKEMAGDAVHLAYASVYEIDFLLTWNCKHLANANKKRHIREINTRIGLFVPEIITPLELFEE